LIVAIAILFARSPAAMRGVRTPNGSCRFEVSPSALAASVAAVDPQRLLTRVAHGDLANVSFSDMLRLVEAFGFELRRTSGSHHVFAHRDVRELLNLQEVRGQAKPYQIRQFLRLVERYALSLEAEQ
jgi:hypothetical protein